MPSEVVITSCSPHITLKSSSDLPVMITCFNFDVAGMPEPNVIQTKQQICLVGESFGATRDVGVEVVELGGFGVLVDIATKAYPNIDKEMGFLLNYIACEPKLWGFVLRALRVQRNLEARDR